VTAPKHTPGQAQLPFRDEVAEAFADGRLSLIVDKPQDYHHRLSMFAGSQSYSGEIRWVHVMSRPAGGEIRGYALLESGDLRLRLPDYTGHWPEMDAAARAAIAKAEGRHG
jgi:hypothetical protein